MNYGMRDQSWRIFSSKKLVFQIWWTKALRFSHPTTSQGMCCILHINVVQTLSMHLWEIEWLAFEYFNGYTFYIYICMPSFTVEVYFEFKKGAKKMSKNSCFKILCNRYTYLLTLGRALIVWFFFFTPVFNFWLNSRAFWITFSYNIFHVPNLKNKKKPKTFP